MKLDHEQRAAIQAPSPVIVNASAGSGKTRCIIAKIAQLIKQNINPENICAITFSNKATNEMKTRLKNQQLPIGNMQISTIHSLCVKILKKFSQYTQLTTPFSIYDENDQISIIKKIIKSKEISGDFKTYSSAINYIKSTDNFNIKNAFRKSNFTIKLNEKDFIYVYEAYTDLLQKNNACDFDDLLLNANTCLSHQNCSNFFSQLWKHILVDEFQDTSLIQYHIISKLHSQTLFVVGDFNQCVIEGTDIHGIPVEKLSEGNTTLSAAGNYLSDYYLITKFYKKYVENEKVITITTKTGKSLTTTLNHSHFAGDYEKHIKAFRNKKNFIIKLGAETRTKNTPVHRYYLSGLDPIDLKKLRSNNLINTRSTRQFTIIEGTSSDLAEIYNLAQKIKNIIPINIIESARFTNKSLPKILASDIKPGMICFIYDNNTIKTDIITSTKIHEYTGYIYDLNINKAHNFIANGIITHNSIYSFRGAHPENMTQFITDHNPSICELKNNYRSRSKIIAHANNFLQYGSPMQTQNNTEIGKISLTQFNDLEDEADKISNALLRYNNFENCAIIYRVNTRSLQFEKAFTRKKIPYILVNSLPYYQRKVPKDLLAYLKASLNRSDIENLLRIVNNPPRGFGQKRKDILIHEGWPYLLEIANEMPRIQIFINLLNDIQHMTPPDAVKEILHRTDYYNTLKKDTDRNMLTSFCNIIDEFETIEDLILASNFIEKDSGHGVKLLTAHSSKGLEFDLVLIVGVEEGLWPHPYSTNLKEEERLYYVAITRAKKILNISYCRNKTIKGKTYSVTPSNLFLKSYNFINSTKSDT